MPHNVDAEMSVLGGVILRNETLALLTSLETDDFYDHKHKVVWQAMRNLATTLRPIDVVTLETEVERMGKLDAIGGIAFLGELVYRVPTSDNVVAYAKSVRDLSALRKVILRAAEIQERAYTWEYEVDELIGDARVTFQALEHSVRAPTKKVGRTWGDCVEEIYARKDEPWIDIRIGAVVVAMCRNGSFVPLVAPSGAGKSTLAIQMLLDHALCRGPAVYLTYELDGDEAVARAIGQQCTFSWAAVLRGEVPRPMVPLVSRLRILEREHATLVNLETVVEELRLEFPGQPVFVVADYLQGTPAPPGKERGFVANVSTELRRTAKKLRVVLVGVSQASTVNSKAMRDGSLLGIDAAATGAETSQIERDAYVILALGDRQLVDHETVSWKLSVAKYRFGAADIVHELHYRGRIGTWEVVGDARTATEVRETRDTETKKKKMAELKRAITAYVTAQTRPVSKKQIVEVSTGKDTTIGEAIKQLIREGVLAHDHRVHRGGHALIWTPAQLNEASSNGGSDA